MRGQGLLYSRSAAEFCRSRELGKSWVEDDREKIDTILSQLGQCDSFLDIGCGWGQVLEPVSTMVPRVVGVDESPHRIKDLKTLCPGAGIFIARAKDLGLRDTTFDVVLTSQMLHEVKLFGEEGELGSTLREIMRVLKPGGRYLLLDHLDPGSGDVTVSLNPKSLSLLQEFKAKFRFREVHFSLDSEDRVSISKRNLQDFVTKIWSFNSPMEAIEMEETHTPFSRAELEELLQGMGFTWEKWVTFENIEKDFDRHGVELMGSQPWNRKFLLIARKPNRL